MFFYNKKNYLRQKKIPMESTLGTQNVYNFEDYTKNSFFSYLMDTRLATNGQRDVFFKCLFTLTLNNYFKRLSKKYLFSSAQFVVFEKQRSR